MPHRWPENDDIASHIERLNSSDVNQQVFAVKELAETLGPDDTEALPALRTVMAQTRTRPRSRRFRKAASAVGHVGTEEGIEILAANYRHPKSSTGATRVVVEAAADLPTRAVPQYVIDALDHEDNAVRAAAAQTIGTIVGSSASATDDQLDKEPWPDPADVREGLLEIVRDTDVHWSVRDSAAQGLIELGDERTADGLRGVVDATSGSAYVPDAAIFALGELGDDRDVDRLTSLLEDEQGDYREPAAEALGRLGTEAAAESLPDFTERSILGDEETVGRFLGRRTVEALGMYDGPEVYETLLEVARQSDNKYVLNNAAEGLLRIGDDRAIPALETAVTNPPAGTTAAARALASLRVEADPATAIECLDRYSSIDYEEHLVEPVVEQGANDGTLELIWQLLDRDIRQGTAADLFQETLARHDAFTWDDIAEFTLYCLKHVDELGWASAYRQCHSTLLDGPGRTVLDRLLDERRRETKAILLEWLTMSSVSYIKDVHLDLLAVIGPDEDVIRILRQEVRDGRPEYAAMALQTLDEIDADGTAAFARELLAEDEQPPTVETAAIDVLLGNADGNLPDYLLDRFRTADDPDHVGSLAERLLMVAGRGDSGGDLSGGEIDPGTVYALLVEKFADASFYAAIQTMYGGYDVRRPADARDDPRRLPAHLYELDHDRCVEDLRSLVRTGEAAGLRADALQTLRVFDADSAAVIAAALEDANPTVRLMAARMCLQDGDDRAIPTLAAMVADLDVPLPRRLEAIRLLGAFDTVEAAEAIIEALQSLPDSIPVTRVHSKAIAVLARMNSPAAENRLDSLARQSTEYARLVRRVRKRQ